MPFRLWQEQENSNNKESCGCCSDEIHPSPTEVDDDVWRGNPQRNDDDSLSGKDSGYPINR